MAKNLLPEFDSKKLFEEWFENYKKEFKQFPPYEAAFNGGIWAAKDAIKPVLDSFIAEIEQLKKTKDGNADD